MANKDTLAGIPKSTLREAAREMRQEGVKLENLDFGIARKLKKIFEERGEKNKKLADLDHSYHLIRDLMEDEFLHGQKGGFKRKSQTERFSRCVKMVRRSVQPLPGSNKESAAIAICTKTILHKRGRTIKRYSKKRLVTQRRK